MPALYKAVDCVVQPSRGEGWGLPIIEAMAMVCSTSVRFLTLFREFLQLLQIGVAIQVR